MICNQKECDNNDQYWKPWIAPGFQLRNFKASTSPFMCELNLSLFLPCCVSEAWSLCLTAHHNSQIHWSSSHYSTPPPLVRVSAHPRRLYHCLYTKQAMRNWCQIVWSCIWHVLKHREGDMDGWMFSKHPANINVQKVFTAIEYGLHQVYSLYQSPMYHVCSTICLGVTICSSKRILHFRDALVIFSQGPQPWLHNR